jgi:hypothetical protein
MDAGKVMDNISFIIRQKISKGLVLYLRDCSVHYFYLFKNGENGNKALMS